MNFTNLLPVPSGALKRNFFYHKNGDRPARRQRPDDAPRLHPAEGHLASPWSRALMGAVLIRPEGVFAADITG